MKKRGNLYLSGACWIGILIFCGTIIASVQDRGEDYAEKVNRALSSGPDLLGEQLLKGPAEPTYDTVLPLLRPLMLCGDYVTTSGVYYLVFGRPEAASGGGDAALHVADGSEIISRQHQSDQRLLIYVGDQGWERFGEDLDRLETPALQRGYYPILVTEYQDAQGTRYRQESFADYLPGTRELASFIRLSATEADDSSPVRIRFELPAGSDLEKQHNKLIRDGRTHLFFSEEGARINGNGLEYRLPVSAGQTASLYIVRPNHPLETGPDLSCDGPLYLEARDRLRHFWDGRLSSLVFQVPEERVMNAVRNLLIQNLFLGWRYSYGNAYEDFFQPEGSDTALMLGLFGYAEEYRAILESLLGMSKGREFYYNWELGEKLSHGAGYFQLTQNAGFIHQNKALYDELLGELLQQIEDSEIGLLRKERYSGDIPQRDYYLHQQAVCWRGIRDMARVYQTLGYTSEARKYLQASTRFRDSLLKAVKRSQRDLPGNSLFIPTRLLSNVSPYLPITGTKLGTYWNLVFPYALASEILPRPTEAQVLSYMLNHGSFFLGLQRCNYYPVEIGSYREGGLPGYSTPGTDNVYSVSMIDVLARHDYSERLILLLYSKLCHGMTRGTYVAGEGDTLGVIPGQYYRSTYLPPNSANNSLLLKIVRTQLLSERNDEAGRPVELWLTPFTPRSWLAQGRRLFINKAPTAFGEVSLEIKSLLQDDRISVRYTPPSRSLPGKVTLRLRAPRPWSIDSVILDGSQYMRFDREKEIIDLSGLAETVSFEVLYRRQP